MHANLARSIKQEKIEEPVKQSSNEEYEDLLLSQMPAFEESINKKRKLSEVNESS